MYFERLQKLYDFVTLIALSLVVFLLLFSHQLIFFLYGTEFLSAGGVLQILSLFIVFGFFGTVNGKFLIAENLTKISLIKVILGAIVNIILNIILIPEFGVYGAAWATVASVFVSGVLSNLFFKETRIVFFMFLKSLNIFRVIKSFSKYFS